MRDIIILPLLIAFIISGCRASRTTGTGAEATAQAPAAPAVTEEEQAHVWDFRDATTWILGDFRLARLLDLPHSSWYVSEYSGYVPDQAAIDELRQADISDWSVTIVLGTWCPDSRREVPRFMKIADMWGFPVEKIRLIGVDINKVAPLADYQALGIERVPTFIFYENNSEAGRIIEIPVTSLEQDTRDILRRK